MPSLQSLQKNFKYFRDFSQFFTISLKPIKYEITNLISMPDILIFSHIFSLGGIDNEYINLGISIVFILAILILLYQNKKLVKFQSEVQSKNAIKNVEAKYIEDPENKQQQKVQDEQKVPKGLFMSIALLLLFINSVFQPIVDGFFFNVVAKFFQTNDGETEKVEWKYSDFLAIASFIFAFIYFQQLYKILKKQIPKERLIVNEKGEEQQWNQATYQGDIEKYNSPFKGMFKPYQSKYCYFEMIIMGIKGTLTILCAVVLKQPYEDVEQDKGQKLASNIIMIIGLFITLLFIFKKKPYFYEGENKIAIILYIFNIIQAILITIVGYFNSEKGQNSISDIIIWVVRIFLYLTPFTQFWLNEKYGPKQSYNMSTAEKQALKKLEFTSLIEMGFKEEENAMLNWLVFNKDHTNILDVRENIWHNYWNNTFQYLPTLGHNQEPYSDLFQYHNFKMIADKYPQFIEDSQQKMTPQKRLVENRQIYKKIGKQNYEKALEIQNNEDYLKIRQNFLLDIQEDDFHNGKQFGYLQINNFPFVGIFKSDNNSNLTEYQEINQMDNLAALNLQDHKIIILKMKRKCFRTFNEQLAYYPTIIYDTQQKNIGSGQASQQYHIHGFKYHKQGQGIYQHTQIQLNLIAGTGANTEKKETSGQSHINFGIDNQNYSDFSIQTHQLMFLNKKQVVKPNLQKVYDSQKLKRSQISKKYYERQEMLSYHFNINIVNNQYLQEDQLQEQLNLEHNNSLKNMLNEEYGKKHYDQMIVLQNQPALVYQHYFYSDIWKKNYDIKIFRDNQVILDPSMKDFIGYKNFESKDQMEKQLINLKLRSQNTGCIKLSFLQGYFNDSILEYYYTMQEYYKENFKEKFKIKENPQIIQTDILQKFLKNPTCKYQELQVKEQEIEDYLESFKNYCDQLCTKIYNETKNYWYQAKQQNYQEIQSFQTKKQQTEQKIKSLESDLRSAQSKLQDAKKSLQQAESYYNSLSQDDPKRSSASSKVSSEKSKVSSAEQKVKQIQRELDLQREILRNIITVLQNLNNNKPQYESTYSMSNSLQQQMSNYQEYVQYVSKNIYVALISNYSNPKKYSAQEYSKFQI